VAARLCGADVVMIAKVGDDLFGEATVKDFAVFGIDTTLVGIVDGVPSGVAPIFVEPNGQNRIIGVKGANETLKPADVDAAAETLREVDTINLQFEIPLETVYYAVEFARKNNIRCIMNPAPALPAQLSELAAADYFVPNETEAEAIAGLPVHSIDDAKKCAGALLQKGFGKVILTLAK
jgi:ribokinase